MQKLLPILAVLCFAGLVSAQAQCPDATSARRDCARTCTKSAAARAATQDPDIEMRTDPHTGRVSYVRKTVCATSRTVSYQEVDYCQKTGAFVRVAPAAGAEKDCSRPCGEEGNVRLVKRNDP